MIVILRAVLTPKIIFLPIYTNPSIQYIGVAVIIVAMVFRLAVVFSLGKFFTVDVTIRKDHKLKKDGPYKYLRHPAYFASLMSFVGMGWTFNNWISFLLIVAAISIVLIKRINIEEKVLIRHFGSEYLEYQNKTYRLIPFIY